MSPSRLPHIKQGVAGLVAGQRVTVDNLSALVVEVFRYCGLDEDDAKLATEAAIDAQLRGSESHGLLHLPLYVKGLTDGTIKARPHVVMERRLPCCLHIDAGNGLGLVISRRAVDQAMALAAEFGLGAAAIRNSSHFGTAGYYADYAAKRNMIALSFSNASPAIAPSGGKQARLGTNPIGAGFPRADGPPVVIDMATSSVARSRIKQALARNEPIPPEWALDEQGQPTTDPAEALKGSVQPIGGPKGYALALMTELFCSAMSDGRPGFEITYEDQVTRPSQVGQFFLVLNPSGFVDFERYSARMRHIAEIITSTPPLSDEAPVRLPGARGQALAEQFMRDGVPMPQALKTALLKAVELLERHAGP